jgi:hypothetical protein
VTFKSLRKCSIKIARMPQNFRSHHRRDDFGKPDAIHYELPIGLFRTDIPFVCRTPYISPLEVVQHVIVKKCMKVKYGR